MDDPRRILVLGGHDFDRRPGNPALCDRIVELADSEAPRICLLPTASGDPADQITRFRRAFGSRGCHPSEIALFRLGEKPVELRDHLLAQDAIYVGGGSLLNLLAIWRAHALDEILREAWEQGVLIVGQSAGAMCWFEGGITSSSGEARPAAGLGFLPGSLCVHYHSEPERRLAMLGAIESGGLPAGLGLDDQAGALFEGTEMRTAFSARPGAGVWELSTAAEPEEREQRIEPERLNDVEPAPGDSSAAVLELRQTLAARASARRAGRTGPGRL